MPYVYSTLSADVNYNDYYPAPSLVSKTAGAEPRVVKSSVLIKGGSGVMPIPDPKKPHVTTFGVRTEVTDHELEFLEQHETFKTQVAAGFIRVERKKLHPEKVAADMELRDDSSPVMPEDQMMGDTNVSKNESSQFDTKLKIPKKDRALKNPNEFR